MVPHNPFTATAVQPDDPHRGAAEPVVAVRRRTVDPC